MNLFSRLFQRRQAAAKREAQFRTLAMITVSNHKRLSGLIELVHLSYSRVIPLLPPGQQRDALAQFESDLDQIQALKRDDLALAENLKKCFDV